MLKIKKLHKSYKMGDSSLHVLKGIDLNIEKGGEKLKIIKEKPDFFTYHLHRLLRFLHLCYLIPFPLDSFL